MKRYFFLFLFPLFVFAHYEPRLKTFSVQNPDKVTFHLDNGWVFEGQFSDPNKIYALDKLIGMRVRIETYPQLPALEISFENPERPGQNRLSFEGFINKETYDSLLTVTDITFKNPHFLWWDYWEAYITLSDGSFWYVETDVHLDLVQRAWMVGDHILVTKKYPSEQSHTLVNLDVSGQEYQHYSLDAGTRDYSWRDARSVRVIPAVSNH